jgi:hypothetical protein
VGDRACGPTDAASDVEYAHARPQPHLSGEVVLLPCERRSEGLPLIKAAEVEGFRPAVFVQLGRAVVVPWGAKKLIAVNEKGVRCRPLTTSV